MAERWLVPSASAARVTPDPTAAADSILEPGTIVDELDRLGGWVRVGSPDGGRWWVDGRRLEPFGAPPPAPSHPPSGRRHLPRPPEPVVALDPTEISDIVDWGVEHNRSPEDIATDLEQANQGRGGSGPVEIPGGVDRVETPDGPVTLTQEEADAYRAAAAERERLARAQEAMREQMSELGSRVDEVVERQQAAPFRGLRGAAELLGRQGRYDDERAALLAEQDQLRRRGLRPGDPEMDELDRRVRDLDRRHVTAMSRAGDLIRTQEQELAAARSYLEAIESGSIPPDPALFPDGGYEEAHEDWGTRDRSGRYFEEAERLRREIADREAGVYVGPVDPRSGAQTSLDRPAHELAALERQRENLLRNYRAMDAKSDELARQMDEVHRRAGGAPGTGGTAQ